eukprot:SAG31_NODE_8360_length_1466_cov_0.955377_1_plen_94_part_00
MSESRFSMYTGSMVEEIESEEGTDQCENPDQLDVYISLREQEVRPQPKHSEMVPVPRPKDTRPFDDSKCCVCTIFGASALKGRPMTDGDKTKI